MKKIFFTITLTLVCVLSQAQKVETISIGDKGKMVTDVFTTRAVYYTLNKDGKYSNKKAWDDLSYDEQRYFNTLATDDYDIINKNNRAIWDISEERREQLKDSIKIAGNKIWINEHPNYEKDILRLSNFYVNTAKQMSTLSNQIIKLESKYSSYDRNGNKHFNANKCVGNDRTLLKNYIIKIYALDKKWKQTAETESQYVGDMYLMDKALSEYDFKNGTDLSEQRIIVLSNLQYWGYNQ